MYKMVSKDQVHKTLHSSMQRQIDVLTLMLDNLKREYKALITHDEISLKIIVEERGSLIEALVAANSSTTSLMQCIEESLQDQFYPLSQQIAHMTGEINRLNRTNVYLINALQ